MHRDKGRFPAAGGVGGALYLKERTRDYLPEHLYVPAPCETLPESSAT